MVGLSFCLFFIFLPTISTVGVVCYWVSLSVFNISKGFAPRVLPLWEVAFLVRFSRVDRLVVNCIAYGVEDSNIDQHWEFLVFYLFFYICFGWKTPQKQVILGKGGAAANSRALWKSRERDRFKHQQAY